MHAERAPHHALDHALLDTWRKQGDDQANPLAFHYMSALRNRLHAHQGPARQMLESKLSGLIAAYAERLQQRPPPAVNAAPATAPAIPARGMLAELADTLANHAKQRTSATAPLATGDAATGAASAHGGSSQGEPMARLSSASAPHGGAPLDGASIDNATAGAAHVAEAPASSPLPELDALGELRRLWSSVRSDSQVKRCLQNSPTNAGPLNSSSLVHRSLNLMREVSPGYLQQFLSYVDVLAGLEQMKDGGILGDKNAPASPGHKPRARAKPRKRPG